MTTHLLISPEHDLRKGILHSLGLAGWEMAPRENCDVILSVDCHPVDGEPGAFLSFHGCPVRPYHWWGAVCTRGVVLPPPCVQTPAAMPPDVGRSHLLKDSILIPRDLLFPLNLADDLLYFHFRKHGDYFKKLRSSHREVCLQSEVPLPAFLRILLEEFDIGWLAEPLDQVLSSRKAAGLLGWHPFLSVLAAIHDIPDLTPDPPLPTPAAMPRRILTSENFWRDLRLEHDA